MPQNPRSRDASSRKLKILMLHGYTQSGPLFQAKTQRLKKLLEKSFSSSSVPAEPSISGVELFYPTGPMRVSSADLAGAEVRDEAYGWWKVRDRGELSDGIDQGLDRVAETLWEHGPVDGVIGFSQGAALAAMVASLLEPGRPQAFEKSKEAMPYPQSFAELRHPPLKFAVGFSGLLMEHPRYAGFYEPNIQTPVLHVMGSMDTIVEESESMALAERCVGGGAGLIIRHSGNHAVPTSERDIAAVIQFIRNSCSEQDKSVNQSKDEEDVLEMDLPF